MNAAATKRMISWNEISIYDDLVHKIRLNQLSSKFIFKQMQTKSFYFIGNGYFISFTAMICVDKAC